MVEFNYHMKIHLFPKGTILYASVRIRCWNFMMELKNMGISCKMSRAFIPSSMLNFSFPFRLYLRIRDLLQVKKEDVVIVYRGTHQPSNPEIFILFRKIIGFTLIFDFDDAIFLDDSNHETAPKSTELMVRKADGVVVGCEYLYEYACKYNKNVQIIRGNIDVNKYLINRQKRNTIVIGWIGSPSNHICLQLLIKPLQKLSKLYKNIQFTIITNTEFAYTLPQFQGIITEIINWDINRYYEDIQLFDIGVIPLLKDEWFKGKSGGKVFEYMAMAIPIVSTPVGPHQHIIIEGVNGFLADNDCEWFDKLRLLIENEELRIKMGAKGREMATSNYSIISYTNTYLNMINITKESQKLSRG